MKILGTFLFLSAMLYGQGRSTVNVTPGLPGLQAPGGLTPPKPVPPETVVAEVDGRKITAAELDKLMNMLPPQFQQAARSRPEMLGQVFLMQRLADDAAKAGLERRSPYKEQLEISRMQLLSTAELSDVNNNMQVSQDEEDKYYKEHPDKFKEVKVRVIYVAFNPTPGKEAPNSRKLPTEAEAKDKIEDLAKQLKAGADFGKLAHDHSDDRTSAAKDGDFGVIKQDSAYPPSIKEAVFALKEGEVTAPLKQPNGFYLIRADEVKIKPMNDELVQIIQAVKQEKFQTWVKGMQAQYQVKVEDPAYFNSRLPAPLPAAH